MKKFFVIIGLLLIIFISMLIYRKQEFQNKNVTAEDVQKIQEYISKIYMWEEVTQEALPKFDDINKAPEIWIWEVVKNNLDIYELSKEQIEEKAKEIFGEKFSVQFPDEGNSDFIYNSSNNKYIASEINIDDKEDSFFVKTIQKDKNTYTVKIVEYLEDYSNAENEDSNKIGEIYLENLDGEKIVNISSTASETEILDKLKENIDKFSIKTLIIQKNSDGKFEIQKVY